MEDKMTNEICLKIENVSFSYPDESGKNILSDISLEIKRGEIVAVMGQNGCGKTTLLNLIAGFVKPVSGKVIQDDGKEAMMIFQEGALLEWKTVYENAEFGLISSSVDEKTKKEKVGEVIKMLGLSEHKDKLPSQLSGGLKQRTAIARALAPDPNLILLDEPFSALDIEVKEELIKEIRDILIGQNKSAIFITHNINEAIEFADRILVIDPKTKRIGKEINVHSLNRVQIEELKKNAINFKGVRQ